MDNSVLLKIGKARAAGYSTKEIVDYLGQDQSIAPKIQLARENKYADEDILGQIAKIEPQEIGFGGEHEGIQSQEQQGLRIGGGLELLGGLIGGLAPTLRQRIPAAAIGGAGGQGLWQVYQHLAGDPNAPKTSEEAATRMGIGGLTEGIGQGTGELLAKGLSKALPHVQQRFMTPDKTGSEETLRGFMEPYLQKGGLERLEDRFHSLLPDALKYGVNPKPGYTIAQKSDPQSGAHRMEQIIESSFFGAKPIKEFKFAQQKGLEDWANKISEDIWQGVFKMHPSERGKVFIEAYDSAEGAFRKAAQQRYAEVDSALKSETVDISPLKSWAQNEAIKNADFAGYGSSQTGDAMLAKAKDLPDIMTFAGASELRSRLIKESSMAEGKDVARRMASIGVSKIDEAMEQAAKAAGGDAEKIWREANTFYKEGKKTFDNEFISSLIKKGKDQPELVGKGLFQNGEITQIKIAKNILKNDPMTFQAMKAGWLDDVLTNSAKSDGNVVGNALFRKLRGMGDETLGEIFTRPELLLLKKFEEASLKTQKLGSAGGGSILIQLMQAGALGGIASGAYFKDTDLLAGGLAILAAPRVMGRMFVNPRFHHLFYNGLSTERPIAIPAITKLAAEAIKVNNQIMEHDQMQEIKSTRVSP